MSTQTITGYTNTRNLEGRAATFTDSSGTEHTGTLRLVRGELRIILADGRWQRADDVIQFAG